MLDGPETSSGRGHLRFSTIPVHRDEPRIRVVQAWWEDLHGGRRERASGSSAAFESERVPTTAIGEAIERRAWLNTHEGGAKRYQGRPMGEPRSESDVPFDSASMRSTNGWACGVDERNAEGRAAAEIVERHLYSLHYLGETSSRVDRSARCLQRARWLARYHLELHTHRIEPRENFPLAVALAYVFDRTLGGPQATIGLGCSPDGNHAADKAILEALKVRVWAYQIKDRVRHGIPAEPSDPVEARLLRLATPAGAEALRGFMESRTEAADERLASDDVALSTADLHDRAIAASRLLGIQLWALDRGPLAAFDLRPVAWVVGQGARFVNDEPPHHSVEIEVPLA